MNKIMEEQIMSNVWHEFLYGEESIERTEFLKGLVEHYPIVYGKDEPMGIYLENYGIPPLGAEDNTQDQQKSIMLKITAREYLKNSIIYSIISRIESTNEVMGQIEKDLIKYINAECYDGEKLFSSVNEFLVALKNTIEVCFDSYSSIIKEGQARPKMFDTTADFRDFDRFGKDLKEILKNDGQFNIIIDYKQRVTLDSIKAIMSVMNMRCANSICMKVGTDSKSWPVYCDLNGRFVEYPHDYTYVELDKSFREEIERQKAKRLGKN